MDKRNVKGITALPATMNLRIITLMQEARHKSVYTEWFDLGEVQEQGNYATFIVRMAQRNFLW